MSIKFYLKVFSEFNRRNGFYATLNYILYLFFRRIKLGSLKLSNFFLKSTRQHIEKNHAKDETLLKNFGLKNNYLNAKGLVLATGPSLKNIQRSDQWKGPIIAINESFYFLQEKDIVADFIILNDDVYFTKDKYIQFLKDLLECSTHSNMRLLFPLGHKQQIDNFINEHKFNPKIYYFYTHLGVQEYQAVYEYDEFDFTKALPGFPTVTHVALCFALYLGFSEVGLLGVDMDYAFNPGSPITHGYDNVMPENTRSNLNCLQEYLLNMNWNYKELLSNTLAQIELFEIIYKIYQKKNVKIYNLSKSSFLEVFPRAEMEALCKV